MLHERILDSGSSTLHAFAHSHFSFDVRPFTSALLHLLCHYSTTSYRHSLVNCYQEASLQLQQPE
jgi:hypothetical protein